MEALIKINGPRKNEKKKNGWWNFKVETRLLALAPNSKGTRMIRVSNVAWPTKEDTAEKIYSKPSRRFCWNGFSRSHHFRRSTHSPINQPRFFQSLTWYMTTSQSTPGPWSSSLKCLPQAQVQDWSILLTGSCLGIHRQEKGCYFWSVWTQQLIKDEGKLDSFLHSKNNSLISEKLSYVLTKL